MNDHRDAYDTLITTRPPRGESHKCGNCYIRGNKAELKICARCRILKYCSRECQAAHWKEHKEICKKNSENVEKLAEADALGLASLFLPPGGTFAALNQRLAKWIKYHNLTLMAATVHALGLPRDIARSRTHVVKMTVRPRPDHGGVAGKFFRIVDAAVVEIAEAQGYPVPWPESLETLAALRAESEQKARGAVAAVGIECLPLGVQFVPFGSLKGLSSLAVLRNWKEIVIRDVENGKKFTAFRE